MEPPLCTAPPSDPADDGRPLLLAAADLLDGARRRVLAGGDLGWAGEAAASYRDELARTVRSVDDTRAAIDEACRAATTALDLLDADLRELQARRATWAALFPNLPGSNLPGSNLPGSNLPGPGLVGPGPIGSGPAGVGGWGRGTSSSGGLG